MILINITKKYAKEIKLKNKNKYGSTKTQVIKTSC